MSQYFVRLKGNLTPFSFQGIRTPTVCLKLLVSIIENNCLPCIFYFQLRIIHQGLNSLLVKLSWLQCIAVRTIHRCLRKVTSADSVFEGNAKLLSGDFFNYAGSRTNQYFKNKVCFDFSSNNIYFFQLSARRKTSDNC